MHLWCNKHLPGQSASIIIAFEFFDMFVSTRAPSVFFRGWKSSACLQNKIPFFNLQVIFYGQMTLIINIILLKLFVIDSLPLMVRRFRKQTSPFWLDNRDVQGLTRLDGAWGMKQVWRLHVRTWGLSEIIYCIEENAYDIVTSSPLRWVGSRGIVPPCPHSWCAIKIGKFSENKQILKSEPHELLFHEHL